MIVETDKCLCNHVDQCSLEDKHICDHSMPHTLYAYCNSVTRCRELVGVVCIPITKKVTPDWEI